MTNIAEGTVIREGVHKASRMTNSLDITAFFGECIPGTGHYVLLPHAAGLMRKLERMLETSLKEEIGFEEVVLPKMAPVHTFQQAGILRKWDSYLLIVTPYTDTQGVSTPYILDPLQCTVLYQYLAGRSIDVSQKPLLWYDCSGPTYRNEDLPRLQAGIRQREFHRAEYVYIGTPEQVKTTREQCLKGLENICEELQLQHRVVVGAGCYEYDPKEDSSLDIIPILDLEIFCPSDNQWLEVAGCSVLGTRVTSRFSITDENHEFLWGGCVGIGLERMMYTVLSTYGTEKKYWPKALQ